MHCENKDCIFYDRILGQCLADICIEQEDE